MTSVSNVLTVIGKLSPGIESAYSNETLYTFISIADTMASGEDIDTDKVDLATALLTLDMISAPDTSNISGTTIGDVTISYSGRGTTKWKIMYDSIVNGEYTDDLSVTYRGI